MVMKRRDVYCFEVSSPRCDMLPGLSSRWTRTLADSRSEIESGDLAAVEFIGLFNSVVRGEAEGTSRVASASDLSCACPWP